METRKLQKVGGGTYTVSVPKEWATAHELGAGDAVRLFLDGAGSLVISPSGGTADEHRTTVRVDGSDSEALTAVLRQAYATGIKRVQIHSVDGPGTRRQIDRIVRDRTGMRIVEESEGGVTVETVLDDREVSLQRSLVQMQFVTLSVFRTAVDLALDASATGTDRIGDRRADASGIAALVARQFARSLSRPGVEADLDVRSAQAFDCYRTARALDRVADYAVDIQADGPLSLDADATERLRSLADGTRLYVEEATAAVIEGDATETLEGLRSTREDLTALFEDAEKIGSQEGAMLLWLLDACAVCGDRISTVAHQAALRRGASDR